ncbi:hypothetical protein [Iningainema tapete]|uniref:Uncharacterized protein n=1 Tax=Iningainema tapete BLCC-T55 TaxID=2748662 RepID=A0A8J7C5E5_9CYAN|nr:hypothetical protein [Iningainema tapete]MBD2770716.1 hypothetical protein [Iningainema tapete BLCC-T55]
MKKFRKIKTVLIASMVAALIVFGSPAMSYSVEWASHQIRKDSNSSNQANSVLVPINSKLLMSNNIPASGIKVRKNVVDLTPKQRKAFVDAVRTLKNTVPSGSKLNRAC